MKTNLSVKDWSPDDQPREKLLLKGVRALSDAELLAIILGSGSREESVVQLAQRVLSSVGNNINQLSKLSVKQLISEFKGIGVAKAVSIVAALEFGKRRKAEDVYEKNEIRCSKDIFRYFYPLLADLQYEEFWAIFLNRGNKVIGKLKISQGGVSETVVDARIIYKEGINLLASGVILCHNHPSGNRKPSHQDSFMTKKIKEGVEMLGMKLLDHLIICGESYYSFSDEEKI
ncbi:DNA repair protein RadC [Bacteroidales bacterium OttesenSCG-928-A17]|nr:DNA repair protein RadC [Bacteroidales bacterium OttesenSCG-928-A17]